MVILPIEGCMEYKIRGLIRDREPRFGLGKRGLNIQKVFSVIELQGKRCSGGIILQLLEWTKNRVTSAPQRSLEAFQEAHYYFIVGVTKEL